MMQRSEAIEAAAARETYLADISSRLHGRLSPLDSFETVQEMRSHLEAMAAAYEEVGLEPLDAMRSAIERFGAAEAVAQGVASTPSRSFACDVRIPMGLLLNIASSAVVGGLLMILFDLALYSLHRVSSNAFAVDMAFGAGPGAFVGMLAWGSGWPGKKLSWILVPIMNVFCVPLWFTLIGLGRLSDAIYLFGGLSLCLLLLCHASTAAAKALGNRLSANGAGSINSSPEVLNTAEEAKSGEPGLIAANMAGSAILGAIMILILDQLLGAFEPSARLGVFWSDLPIGLGAGTMISMLSRTNVPLRKLSAMMIVASQVLCLPLYMAYLGMSHYGEIAILATSISSYIHLLCLANARISLQVSRLFGGSPGHRRAIR